MMRFGRLLWSVGVAATGLGAVQAGARAQGTAERALGDTAGRGPLARNISIHLTSVPIEVALRTVATEGDVRLAYSSDVLPTARRVSIHRDAASVGDVLREVLRGTGLRAVTAGAGQIVVVGDDANDGVAGDGIGTPDLATTSGGARVIDRVIIMGTPVAGAPERGLASAVTVVTAEQIDRLGIRQMDELFRTLVPGIVVWDGTASGPLAQVGGVRGSSSFNANYLKTYVDGVEISSPQLLFAIDPRSIERLEVIRGPQGSALYGSDAINGVVQIVTHKGHPSTHTRPTLDASAAGGLAESRYVDRRSAVQDHTLLGSLGTQRGSIAVGAAYDRDGPFVPGGRSEHLGVFGGTQLVRGPLRVSASVRHYDLWYVEVANPLLDSSVVVPNASRLGSQLELRHQGAGVTAEYEPSVRWQQALTVGYDRHDGALPTSRGLAPVSAADALLGVTEERAGKASVRYNTTYRVPLSLVSVATFIGGVEHTRLHRERLTDRFEAGSGAAVQVTDDDVRNTGYFAQAKLGWREALFVTAGLRGEQNTTFGRGRVWSPMLGAAYVHGVGPVTVKVRGAYGRGIRPRDQSAATAVSTPGTILSSNWNQLANPELGPESQSGVEGGLEIYVGDRVSLRATTYSQRADGLVQSVVQAGATDGPNGGTANFQQQNVGRIENDGVELEGSAHAGPLRVDAALTLVDSRVRRLAPQYTGDLRVGDRVPEIPTAVGEGSLSFVHGGFVATAGVTYVGSWIGYDWAAFYDPRANVRRPTLRDYRMRYPALAKPRVAVTQRVVGDFSLFATVENLANAQRNERHNLQVTAGRVTTVGVRYRP